MLPRSTTSIAVLLLLVIVYQNEAQSTEVPIYTCDETNSKNFFIYCQGPLLDAVMKLSLFNDSKTFVDRPLKRDPLLVKQAFDATFNGTKSEDIDKAKLRAFVDEHFEPEGDELVHCDLEDWQESPPQLLTIKDKSLQKWAMDMNAIWKKLCRKMKDEVKTQPDRYSLLYVPNQFIAPGGRFREFYYWDTYWVIKGLLISGMHKTAKGMIGNFAHIINQFGFIPNGGRVYYLKRSQPPLLTGMVYEYFEATGDVEFIREMLPVLEKELHFWNDKRNVSVPLTGESITMYQYRTEANTPRPESYREDVHLIPQDDPDAPRVYRNLGSAAESGWDFSSRWFDDAKTLQTIDTVNVVPVDLNAYICGNLNMISFLYDKTGQKKKSLAFSTKYQQFRDNFKKVFYVENEGGWYDYNLRHAKHNYAFYASMAVPLFTQCYDHLDTAQVDKLHDKLSDMHAFDYKGIPTSLLNTSQQWDFPNGWSPLNHMLIEGLRRSGSGRMQQKAYQIAEKWVLSNFLVWSKSSKMYEKYDVDRTLPDAGTGGEYEVQDGFGWSNGVVMDLMVTYSDRMLYFDDSDDFVDTVSVRSDNDAASNASESLDEKVVAIHAALVQDSKTNDASRFWATPTSIFMHLIGVLILRNFLSA
uniref:Trehalase n=1 Tax=Panagrellus redivivus TaxID=6233 RepID=A0A7E4WAJ8_PANRE